MILALLLLLLQTCPGGDAQACAAQAAVARDDFPGAASAFEKAATSAEIAGDARAATLWVQAGNAALAAGDPYKARQSLDRALALPALTGELRGEALLDRARAYVALAQEPAARTDLDAALKLVAGDPFAWLLSATLARRQGEIVRAQSDIGEAERRAPGDAAIAFEAGNIAQGAGDAGGAQAAWGRAAKAGPESDAGRAAAAALAASQTPAPALSSNP